MIALDTETTGLLKPEATEVHLQPFITEIYIVKFDSDFNIQGEFETFIKPPVPIPEFIQKITNITNEMVATAPAFIEIYDDLCDFVRGEEISFAHNASFDNGVIRHELARHDLQFKFPWPSRPLCTVEMTECIQNKRLKLKDLYKLATGKPEIVGAHRAKTDVLALLDCIKWMKTNGLV